MLCTLYYLQTQILNSCGCFHYSNQWSFMSENLSSPPREGCWHRRWETWGRAGSGEGEGGRLWMGSLREPEGAQDRWTDFLMPHSDAQPNRWQLAATSCKVTANAALNKWGGFFCDTFSKIFKNPTMTVCWQPRGYVVLGGAGYLPGMRAPTGILAPGRAASSRLEGGKWIHHTTFLLPRPWTCAFLSVVISFSVYN